MASKKPILLPQHQRLIDASGISKEVSEARGYRSATDQAELVSLGFAQAQCRVPALMVPVHGVDGTIRNYQIRPDDPRTGAKGKVVKYETPPKSKMALDVHPAIRDKIGDPTVPLFITEGIRKADSAITKGLCCIALLGVWNWRGANELGGKTALPDWELIALNDRAVYICFDSDATTKPQVCNAMTRLKAFLGMKNAKVQLICLPPGENGAKVGLDDYLAAGHSVEEIMALVSEAIEYGPTEHFGGDIETILTHRQLVEGDLPDVEWIVDGLIPRGGIVMVSGDSGVGKSWLMLHLAQSVASGTAFLGKFSVTPCEVLVLDAESGPSLLKRRVKKLLNGLRAQNSGENRPADLPVSFITSAVRLNPEIAEQFSDYLLRESITLVVVDPLVHYCSVDENSAEAMAAFFEVIRRIAQEAGCAFVFTHHTRKQSRTASNAAGQMLRGSSAIRAVLDSHISVSRSRDGELTIVHDKCRCAQPIAPFSVVVEDTDEETTVCRYLDGAKENKPSKATSAREYILSSLASAGRSMARKELVRRGKGKEISERTIGNVLSKLIDSGDLRKQRIGNSTEYSLANGEAPETDESQ